MRYTFTYTKNEWKVIKFIPSEIEDEGTTQVSLVPTDLITKLEVIKTLEYQDFGDNISFDIHYNNGNYTGIHNCRLNLEQKQHRFKGVLNFTIEELAILQGLI